jgi:hypothetical protein
MSDFGGNVVDVDENVISHFHPPTHPPLPSWSSNLCFPAKNITIRNPQNIISSSIFCLPKLHTPVAVQLDGTSPSISCLPILWLATLVAHRFALWRGGAFAPHQPSPTQLLLRTGISTTIGPDEEKFLLTADFTAQKINILDRHVSSSR